MSPAFSGRTQAALFGFLLLVLLLLPALPGRLCLPDREQIYLSLPWRLGAYPYLHQQIFEEHSDIDMAFMGSSRIWNAIDTPKVQEELGRRTDHQAVVRSLNWNWSGFDALYFIARDLLEHRKVRMLVIYNEHGGSNEPHYIAPYWFRFGDDGASLKNFPLKSRMAYYFAGILGMPRNLLGLLRSGIPADLEARNYWEEDSHAPNPARVLGSLQVNLGCNAYARPWDTDFTDFEPPVGKKDEDVAIYGSKDKAKFVFSGSDLSVTQLYYAKQLGIMLRQHNTRLVIIHLPLMSDRENKIPEKTFWPEVTGMETCMLGIPAQKLFSGMDDSEVTRLFYRPDHFNKNGMKFFTSIITPRLLDIYEDRKQD